MVSTVSGLLGLVAQTPAGGLIDSTRANRGLIVAASAVLGVGAAGIYALPSFWPAMIANTAMAVASVALAALMVLMPETAPSR